MIPTWPFSVLGEAPHVLACRDLPPIEVLVLDSGVDATHPALAGRVAAAYHIEIENDRPRVVEISPNTNNDVFGHGTAVAGVVCGLAPNARIVDVRVLGANGVGSGPALLEGLRFAVENRKSKIVNMSLAAKVSKDTVLGLCETAYYANQIIVASKRNNAFFGGIGFPAEFSNCISVDTESFPTQYAFKYQQDSIIEFEAHGEEVVVPAPGGGYTTKTGTSFATPAVAGICALLVGAYPELRPFELKTLLRAWSVNPPPQGAR